MIQGIGFILLFISVIGAIIYGGYLAKFIDVRSELRDYWFFLKQESKLRYYLNGHGLVAFIFYLLIGTTEIFNENVVVSFQSFSEPPTETTTAADSTLTSNGSSGNLNTNLPDSVKTDTTGVATADSITTNLGLALIQKDTTKTSNQELGDLSIENKLKKWLSDLTNFFSKVLYAFILGFSLTGIAKQSFIPSVSGGKSFSFSSILDPLYDDVIRDLDNIVPGNMSSWVINVDKKLQALNKTPADLYTTFFNYLRHHKDYQTEQGKARLVTILKTLLAQSSIQSMIHKSIEELGVEKVIYALRPFKAGKIKY